MRRVLASAILMVVAACAPASVAEPSTSLPAPSTSLPAPSTSLLAPSTSTTISTTNTTSTTLPPGPAKVPVEEIKAIADQVLAALGAENIGWDETHGPETSYVSAGFEVDGDFLVVWVVVGEEIEDLLGLFGLSYRPYDQYEPVMVPMEVGDVETYVLPPTDDVDYEVRLARLVGVCGKYQVAIETADEPDVARMLETAVSGVDCS